MILIGIIFLCLSLVLTLYAAINANEGLTIFIIVLILVIVGSSFIIIDSTAERNEMTFLESYISNKIPINYENPDNIEIIIDDIDSQYIYSKYPVVINIYKKYSSKKMFITKKNIYIIGEYDDWRRKESL